MKNLRSGSGVVSCGRTDRHDEALVVLKLTVISKLRVFHSVVCTYNGTYIGPSLHNNVVQCLYYATNN